MRRTQVSSIFLLGLMTLASCLTGANGAQTNIVFSLSSSWRYQQDTNFDGVNWQGKNFDDSDWPSGQGLLAYETCGCLPDTIRTTLTTNNAKFTFYFRTTFTFAGNPSTVALVFSNLLDDGAVFYLNGVEIQRVGMSAGPVYYSTPASRTVGNATSYDVFLLAGSPLTNLVVGTNVLAVEVHQINATSSDIVFGSSLRSITGLNAAVTRGPYLQSGSHTNIFIRWRTDQATDGRVWYGTNLASLAQNADNPTNSTEHEVAVDGLSPDTKYYYAVGTTSALLAGSNNNHFFLTAPVPGTAKPTRVWVIGDSGTGTSSQIGVRNAYETFTGSRHTDLWLMLGDNAYDTGTDGEYQSTVFNIYTNLLRKSVLWPTLGNHDTGQFTNYNNSYPYFSIFTLPRNGDCSGLGSGTEHYYSFDYGNIHFICLDSMTADRATNGAMACWLRLDLAETTNNWVIAYWHHPVYTKGSHNSDTEIELIEMRENFLPILEDGGVDLVLAGHSHVYERSLLLDRHYGLSSSLTSSMKLDAGSGRENGTGAYKKPVGGPIAHQGTVYSVVGSSGQTSSSTSGLNHPAMFISLNNLGSLVLDISSNRLEAKFLRETGATNDFFTILKQNYPPVVSNLSVSVSADFSTNLALSGQDLNRDAFIFRPKTLPARGLLANFNAVSGAFTYTPAHGFSGTDSFTFDAIDGWTNSSIATVALNVVPRPDGNTNGMPDNWEAGYGVANANGDLDADGLSNLQEYLANTNPTNAASALRILQVVREVNGYVTLTWESVGGTRYRVGYSDGAMAGVNAPFSGIVRSVAEEMNAAPVGSVSNQSFTDDFSLTGPASQAARYYRIEVVR